MKTGNFDLDKAILLVAETGNAHEGNFDKAAALIDAAAESGAAAVKFHCYKVSELFSENNREKFEFYKKLEFSPENLRKLRDLAFSKNLLFFLTPYYTGAVKEYQDIVDAFNISSGDLDFIPLLDEVCESGKPVILSTACADLQTVTRAVDFMSPRLNGAYLKDRVAVLHCVAGYPVPPEETNLRAIRMLADELDVTTGYSDHSDNLYTCLAAAASGAKIIEKHLILERKTAQDVCAALPAEMKELADKIQLLNKMLGQPSKTVCPCEKSTLLQIKRSIAAKNDLKKGHVLDYEDITWLRPGTGIRPGNEHTLVGKTLIDDVQAGELFNIDQVK